MRLLSVVKSKPEWITYVRDFNDPHGFMFADSPILDAIVDAIEADNDIHSGNSIAMCLRACQTNFKRN